jgi:hypothetical protein
MKKPKSKGLSQQKKRIKSKQKTKQEQKQQHGNWVEDKLDWISVDKFHTDTLNTNIDDDGNDDVQDNVEKENDNDDDDGDQQHDDNNNISIISWNVLADAYCNRSSHTDLPMKFQRVVFDRKRRQNQVRHILQHVFYKKIHADLIALQEVDPPLGIAKCMKSMGYAAVETVSSPDGRSGRVDSCGLYYQEEKWNCLESKTIFLDDLATLRSGNVVVDDDKDEDERKKLFKSSSSSSIGNIKGRNNNLQGLQVSFVRKNVALLVRLEHIQTKRQVVVVVAHLFWNPAYEYVKVGFH